MIAKDFREKARNSLQGKWQTALIVSLIYSIVICVLNSIGAYSGGNIIFRIVGFIIAIATIVISPALMYGVTSAFMKINKGEEVAPFDFLKLGFDNFGRSWGLTGHILLKCLPYVIALVVLYIVMAIAAASTFVLGMATFMSPTNVAAVSNATGTVGTAVIAIVLAIAFMIVGIFFAIKAIYYVLSTYLAIDNPEMTTKDAVQKSEALMQNNRWRYFCLVFSFIGWAILAGLVGLLCVKLVGWLHIGILTTFASEIGTLVLTPYIVFATIAFYEDMIGKNKTKEDAIEANAKSEE